MKVLIPAISIAMLVVSCMGNETASTDNTDSTTVKTDSASDWIALFDGKNIDQWHIYGGKPVGSSWKVADGLLVIDTLPDGHTPEGHSLVTNEEFENFDLKLEWRISAGGNSGILFYVVEDTAKYPEPYHTGPEMQVLDNERHPDAKIPKHRAGDLYDLIACSRETVKPAGEWNQVEIISNNGKLDFWLNGTNVVSTTMWDENWKKMLAASKFAQWSDFGTYKKGRICLQDHSDFVSYRNIMIKKL